MTDILYKKGEKVVIRDYRAEGKERPYHWNCQGEMDHYMGKTITLESNTYSGKFIHDMWRFKISDIKGRAYSIDFPDELFIVK